MSRNNATGAFQGFSVVQPFLGAPLQWLPALGTQELDEMINAFLPGPSSLQDKRAHISMDFFEYSRQTGETFKFYPVTSTSSSFTSAATTSPASSTPLYDSGYSSNYNVSPVMAETQWTESPTFTPVSFDEASIRSPAPSSSKRTAASSSRQRTTDFANHPGMRIMTKDGRDVTNSASRGCKTKEQRDHAHLMRIIKACDSCKRKKIRCDPSHKKRTASQAASSPTEQKTSKKSKKKAADPPPVATNDFSLDLLDNTDLSFDLSDLTYPSFETSTDNLDELWDQLVQQDQSVFANEYLNYIPDDYNFFNDQLSQVSPSSGSASTTPPQAYTPYTPTPPGPSPPTVVHEMVPELSHSDPTLPYLNPGVPHGTDYVDFNLFSPPSDFLLDEEPLPMRKRSVPDGRRPHSVVQPRSPTSAYDQQNRVSPSASLDGPVSSFQHLSESPSPQQWSSPGGIGDTKFFTPEVQTMASPGDVLNDSGGTLHEPRVSHSYCLTQHLIDRPPPGLDSDGSYYYHEVRSAVSQSERVGMTGQSTVTAPVIQSNSQVDGSPTVLVSPSLDVVRPAIALSAVSSSRPAVSPAMATRDAGVSHALVNPVDTQPSRRRLDSPQSSAPSVLVQGVDAGVKSQEAIAVAGHALAPVSVWGQRSPAASAGSDQLARIPSGVQQGLVTSGVDVGPTLSVVIATALVSTMPVRRLLTGEAAKHGRSSSPSSPACSQLVVLGLVSYLVLCLMDAQYLGSLHDLLNTLVIITTVTLTVLTTQHRLSLAGSTQKASSAPSRSTTSLIDNVTSSIQAPGRKFHDFRCTVRQRATSFVGQRISLPRLTSIQSVGRF